MCDSDKPRQSSRTDSSGTDVHITRCNHVGDNAGGAVTSRCALLLNQLFDRRRRVEYDDGQVHDFEGEDVTVLSRCRICVRSGMHSVL